MSYSMLNFNKSRVNPRSEALRPKSLPAGLDHLHII